MTWLDAWTPAGGRRPRAAPCSRAASRPSRTAPGRHPGRVNLIGEHTDYNGGLCLPIALPHRTYAALRRRDDDLVRLVSRAGAGRAADRRPRRRGAGHGRRLGRLRRRRRVGAARRPGHAVAGFDVAIDSCVPYGAGLSSSAALEASVAVALDAVFGLGLAASDDAAAPRSPRSACAPRTRSPARPTGGMDQAASLRSQDGHALLLDCLDGSVRHVPFDLAAHDLALLVVDTRAEHALVDGQYAARRASCEAAAARLGRRDAARDLRRPPRAGVGAGQARRRGPGAPRPARGQRDRPRDLVRRAARRRARSALVGTADERVARLAARRLRGVVPRARPGGRHRPCGRCRSARG